MSGRVAKVAGVTQADVMSASAAQADAFYREALEHQLVWGIRDADGFPAPETPQGRGARCRSGR